MDVNRRTLIKQGICLTAIPGLLTAIENAQAQGSSRTTNIVIYLYDGMTALDALGPYESLRFLPNANLIFTAKQKGLVKTDSKVLRLEATASLDEVNTADILLIPGGGTTYAQMQDKTVVDWVRKLHSTTRWTTSVCTGSGLLVAAGLLKGLKATTHWASMLELRALGVNAVNERIVREGKIITAAGVSAPVLTWHSAWWHSRRARSWPRPSNSRLSMIPNHLLTVAPSARCRRRPARSPGNCSQKTGNGPARDRICTSGI